MAHPWSTINLVNKTIKSDPDRYLDRLLQVVDRYGKTHKDYNQLQHTIAEHRQGRLTRQSSGIKEDNFYRSATQESFAMWVPIYALYNPQYFTVGFFSSAWSVTEQELLDLISS